MALVKCKECHTEVSSKAETCPKCGARIARKPLGFGTLIGVVFLGGIIAAAFSNLFSYDPGSTTPAVLADPEAAHNKDSDWQKIAWMDKGKAAAQAKLKDPQSAQFRNVYFHRGADNLPMTCGEVNSKNSFGGYGGFQLFISAGNPDLTYLSEQVADFDAVWNRFCR